MQVPFPPVITGPAHSCVWLLTSMLCFMLYISWQCRLFTTVNCTCLNLSCRGPFISHELKSFLKGSSYFDTCLRKFSESIIQCSQCFTILVSICSEFLSHSWRILQSSAIFDQRRWKVEPWWQEFWTQKQPSSDKISMKVGEISGVKASK
jgi:hypothetical protein